MMSAETPPPGPRPARLGALQIGSSPDGTAATLAALLGWRERIAAARLDVLVLPEALLGGYPRGADFGARLGYRTPAGREAYLRYWREAIALDGPEVAALCELAAACRTALVVGAIERAGGTLYCVTLLIDAAGVLIGRHRKLVPTALERLVWGQGDGSTLATMETAAGRIGSGICWENYMPLFRTAMYEKQLDVWCASTVDDRDIWQVSMRHIAYEARCFLISACQYQPATMVALGDPVTLRDRPEDAAMIRGGSLIVSPLGEVVAGPLVGAEGLVIAAVDLDDVARARFDLDVVGHYARPDVFTLTVRAPD
jgi:nitrilase